MHMNCQETDKTMLFPREENVSLLKVQLMESNGFIDAATRKVNVT